jgi:hypothetical protein
MSASPVTADDLLVIMHKIRDVSVQVRCAMRTMRQVTPGNRAESDAAKRQYESLDPERAKLVQFVMDLCSLKNGHSSERQGALNQALIEYYTLCIRYHEILENEEQIRKPVEHSDPALVDRMQKMRVQAVADRKASVLAEMGTVETDIAKLIGYTK